jgi:hypothetical protein
LRKITIFEELWVVSSVPKKSKDFFEHPRKSIKIKDFGFFGIGLVRRLADDRVGSHRIY